MLAGRRQSLCGRLREVSRMRSMCRSLVVLSAAVFLCACLAYGQDQDAPSLGDAARQNRLQKQQKDAQAKDAPTKSAATGSPTKDVQDQDNEAQSKDAPSKDAADKSTPKTPHVITNDEIPEHTGAGAPSTSGYQNPGVQYPSNSGSAEAAGEQWKSAIQGQKNAISSLQGQINSLQDSIKFAPGNCVSGCVQWNERQRQKQEQVESMKSQLEQMQKQLEDMQEACRKQGFGSSVYDP